MLALFLIVGVIGWLVTRWSVWDGALRIDTGLIRRSSKRFPLAQVQAIDVVQPGVARVFGLAELRLRMGGSQSGQARLAYLPEPAAMDLRARLLATGPRLWPRTCRRRRSRCCSSVPPPRLLASIFLSGFGVSSWSCSSWP